MKMFDYDVLVIVVVVVEIGNMICVVEVVNCL